jgi:hypothetical protein
VFALRVGCALGCNEFDFFFRKWRIQTHWWVQNWNLRHIYKICFLIFWAVFSHLALKFAKSANMTPKKIFWQKSKTISKNAEFHADFESVEKVVKKCTKKNLQAKKVWRTWVKVEKVHISVTYLLITFFGFIFSILFQRIRNQREIQRFLTPILNFLINFLNFDKFVKIVVPYCGFTTA